MAVTEHIRYSDSPLRAKTVCTSHVLDALGIPSDSYRYSGTERQLLRLARRRWGLRSVRSRLGRKATVGGSRSRLEAIAKDDIDIVAFMVIVSGHVLLLNPWGRTIVDTDPRDRDTRPIVSIYAVRSK